uniref:EF-hand domain-containing protein n=1 Tax=Zooxanthella nutricula TaxID=1333877 RepID=A0A7S2VL55_9DINO
MKEKIRQSAAKEEYDVANFYHTTGVWQAIARHSHFEKLTLGVIAFNALWISIDTDLNFADLLIEANPEFQIAEHAFCIYFCFEWYVRFKSFKVKRNGLKDGWFVFDSCLVGMMFGETWVMNAVMILAGGASAGGLGDASILRMARLLRLSRMARMARLFRAMPELLILIKGMVAAMRSVIFTLSLLAIVMYVFGIAFTQLVGDSVKDPEGNALFATVHQSMHTLLLDGTLMDGTGTVVQVLAEQSPVYVIMFYLFILLAALTVMNMLIGVLCEVVSAVAATEKETLMVAFVKGKVKQVMEEGGLDSDGDGTISKEEFSKILEYPDACRALEEVGVDVYNLVDNVDFIFGGEESMDGEMQERQLSFGDFMDLVLTLRGSNTATVKDIVDLRKFINVSHQRLRDEFTTKSKVLEGESNVRPASLLDSPENVQFQASNSCCPPKCHEPSSPPATASFADAQCDLKAKLAAWSPPAHAAGSGGALRHARLVEALVTAQAELQRFMEVLPPAEFSRGDGAAGHPALPGSLPDTAAEEQRLQVPAGQTARTMSFCLQNPLRVRWLPGQLSELQGSLYTLQNSLSAGLGDLQRLHERREVRPLPPPTKAQETLLM